MDFSPVFDKLVNAAVTDRIRYIDCSGGTRSGKTYSILQFLIILACSERKPKLTSICSESLPHLRRGAIRDFKDIMRSLGLFDENAWNASNNIYTFPNGSEIEFFSIENAGKVHGASRERLFINEAQNISWDVARQLFVRTRGLVIMDYNPTHEFWVHTEIRNREGVVTIKSTYRDNPFLSREQIAEIEAGKKDALWWKVYGEGEIGSREGLVFQDWEIVPSVPMEAQKVGRGIDFGYVADPTAIVEVFKMEGALYLDEKVYERGLTNDIIAKKLIRMGDFPANVADSAELKSISELRNYGVKHLEPSQKGKGSILFGIDILKRYDLKVTRQSTNILYELRNYMWKTDKFSGEVLNVPIDKYNHALDAIRYVAINCLAEKNRQRRPMARTFSLG